MSPWPRAPSELSEALGQLNRLRASRSLDEEAAAQLERACDALFGASRRLIAYGSLAPGGAHADEVADLGGQWKAGWVTGRLVRRGWGAAEGYPALLWSPDGDRVAAQLLTSGDLPQHWERLDAFEGPEYRRVLAPFFTEQGLVAVGNLYELDPDR